MNCCVDLESYSMLREPGQHVPVIESKIQLIKERFTAHENSFLYVMTRHLLSMCFCAPTCDLVAYYDARHKYATKADGGTCTIT